MKKVLVFAVALIMAMSVYAVSTAGLGNVTSTDNAQIPVKFDLKNIEGSWEIGFTNDVSKLETDDDVPELTEIVLTHDDVSNRGKSAADSVYVYWKLSGTQLVEISLKADSAMKSENLTPDSTESNDFLNWKTSWSENNSAEGGTVSAGSLGGDTPYTVDPSVDYSTSKAIYTRSAAESMEVTGYAALSIETQDVATATPSSYTGQLTLTIKPVEGQQ